MYTGARVASIVFEYTALLLSTIVCIAGRKLTSCKLSFHNASSTGTNDFTDASLHEEDVHSLLCVLLWDFKSSRGTPCCTDQEI